MDSNRPPAVADDSDFVDPSPRGKLVITWPPMQPYLRTLPARERLPWLRAYALSCVVVLALFIGGSGVVRVPDGRT